MASASNGANLGFQNELRKAADALPDVLLPKLISGEMQLKEAQRIIGRNV